MNIQNATRRKLIIFAGNKEDPEPTDYIYLKSKEEKEVDTSKYTQIVINEE